ncbi:glycosyltransferase [Emticicia sp. BO119]|uniref:glycosyltransferase n=1 Tax=Emticicia sp. BO119 TaxID=2757768 RepID=UPI0015F05EAE|nr:glycosyltransferase [Emticicia sp. BO119]MBA4852245.1 glycosyltransferase [Emticicia sp. BO119]
MNIGLTFVWLTNQTYRRQTDKQSLLNISVIIPVRNEAENIINLLKDLARQSYPKDRFEVIVADDDSTDETLALVKNFQKVVSIELVINTILPDERNVSPKKRAIESSIQLARGELIVTTDGDCRVGEEWLETIANFQTEKDAYLISAPVTFINDAKNWLKSLWQQIQTVEFSSLIGSGACSVIMKKPNMCNGANLAYLKSVFYEVGGFSGNENLASGDDEFLMHKIATRFPDKVHFLKSQAVIVETQAHDSLKSFYYQRKRWASKWKYYDSFFTTVLAVFIFLANFSLIVTAVSFGFRQLDLTQLLIIFLLKFSAELLFLIFVLSFLGKKNLIWLIPFVQLMYPLYVTFFGLVTQGKNEYIWKGRKLR